MREGAVGSVGAGHVGTRLRLLCRPRSRTDTATPGVQAHVSHAKATETIRRSAHAAYPSSARSAGKSSTCPGKVFTHVPENTPTCSRSPPPRLSPPSLPYRAHMPASVPSSSRSVGEGGAGDSAETACRSSGVMSTSTAASDPSSCSTLRAPRMGAVTAG